MTDTQGQHPSLFQMVASDKSGRSVTFPISLNHAMQTLCSPQGCYERVFAECIVFFLFVVKYLQIPFLMLAFNEMHTFIMKFIRRL